MSAATLKLVPDAAMAFSFYQTILGDEPTEFRLIHPQPPASMKKTLHLWGWPENEAQLGALAEYNAEGYGVYVVINRCAPGVEQRCKTGKGARDEDITDIHAVFVDLDHEAEPGSNLAKLKAAPIPLSALVCTGLEYKLQGYWTVTDLPPADFERVQAALIAYFDSDPVVKNLSHVMRLPGFINTKPKYDSPLVKLLEALGHVYTFAQFCNAFGIPLEAPKPPERPLQQQKVIVPPDADRLRKYALAALQREADTLAAMPADSGRNSRLNRAAFVLGGFIPHGLLERGEIEDALMDAARACGLVDDDGERACLTTLESGLSKAPPRDLEKLERKASRVKVRTKPAAALSEALEQAKSGGAENLKQTNEQVFAALADQTASAAEVEQALAALKEATGVTLAALRKDYAAFQKAHGYTGKPERRREAGDYALHNGVLCRTESRKVGKDDWETMHTPLCNFDARITAEVERDDGLERTRTFTLEGNAQTGQPLPPVEVSASQFGAMNWPVAAWGTQAVVYAGQGNKDHLRAAIQLLSEPERRTVYTHTGWREVNGQNVYLHAGGAIGKNNSLQVKVDLSGELGRFALPTIPTAADIRTAVRSSLALLDLAPDRITAPLLAAPYRAVLGGADFGLHIAGQTGSGKTQQAALIQQHFGPGMSAEHLPGSWTSTANALEGLLFLGKDAVIVVDDFNPTGTANDIARYHATAERIFRAVGNQAGRGRMGRDGSTLRAAKPPRALIVSTGEDIPKGHSLRARMLILETRKEDLDWEMLTAAQAEAQAGTYALALASFIHWLAEDLPRHRARFGEHHLSERARLQAAHARTADIGGQLLATWKTLLEFAADVGALTSEEVVQLGERARQGILEALEPQADHQAVADPVGRFMTLLGALLSSGRAHVATPQGTYPGEGWGWREAETASGVYRPQGARLGWLADKELWLEPDSVYAEAQRLATAQGDTLPTTQQSLWQRLAERGLLVQSKEGKKTRNTLKRAVEGSSRRVLIVPSYTLEKVGSVGSNPEEGASKQDKPAPHPLQESGEQEGSRTRSGEQGEKGEVGSLPTGKPAVGNKAGPKIPSKTPPSLRSPLSPPEKAHTESVGEDFATHREISKKQKKRTAWDEL